MTMRTKEMEARYNAAREAGRLVPLGQEIELTGAPTFHYWKLVANRFPHDRHHTRHILIVLRRDGPIEDVTLEELEELWYRIVPWADDYFDYVKLNLKSLRSVNTTPHLHLLVLKPEYK